MEKLLIEKIETAKELRSHTKKIISMPLKTEYLKVSEMIDERQSYIEKIDSINAELNELDKSFVETNEIKALKRELRQIFKEVSELDNLIRRNINDELKNVKKNLNQPETLSKSLNIKA